MKKLLLSIVAIFMGFSLMATPVYAKCTQTAILGNSVCDKEGNKAPSGAKVDNETYFNCSCDEKENGEKEDGEGVRYILRRVVEILTVTVGILATIGLGVSGVQYLTAGGNEEMTRKAKRRIFEIVLGLVAYVLAYAFLNFIIPDFKLFS